MALRGRRRKAEEESRGGDRFADRPMTQAANDRLHFSRLVNFLADFIDDEERDALYRRSGSTGMGKREDELFEVAG